MVHFAPVCMRSSNLQSLFKVETCAKYTLYLNVWVYRGYVYQDSNGFSPFCTVNYGKWSAPVCKSSYS